MAESSTIARPYAEALFGVARSDAAGLAAWVELTAELAQVAAQPDVATVLADPKLSAAQRAELFAGLMRRPLSERARQFVALLAENDRLSLMPEIAHQFAELRDRHEGSAQARIISAHPLSDAQTAELVASLKQKFGVNLKPTVEIDASLIGGVQVIVGDQVLDTSVRAQLQRMRDALVA